MIEREEFIKQVAELIAGLQVPVSMGVPIGTARPAWSTLHRGLHSFGWARAEDYEREIREVLA